MSKYARYVVVGSKKLVEHGYSAQIGANALNYAIQCADHHSMHGSVYGEDTKGNRELIYANKHNSQAQKQD